MGPGICLKLFLLAADPKRESSCLLRGAAPAPPLGWERFQSTFPDSSAVDLLMATAQHSRGQRGQPRGSPGVPLHILTPLPLSAPLALLPNS